jgi:hypothetical protein
MNCMTFGGVGVGRGGGWLSMGPPSTHNMSSMSLASYVHGIMGIVRWINHRGIVLSWGLEF